MCAPGAIAVVEPVVASRYGRARPPTMVPVVAGTIGGAVRHRPGRSPVEDGGQRFRAARSSWIRVSPVPSGRMRPEFETGGSLPGEEGPDAHDDPDLAGP